MKTKKSKKCHKVRYKDDLDAKIALANIKHKDSSRRPKQECRVYHCPRCKGWHTTSMTEYTETGKDVFLPEKKKTEDTVYPHTPSAEVKQLVPTRMRIPAGLTPSPALFARKMIS